MLNAVKKKKKGKAYSLILNLDLNKAYDIVDWDFGEHIASKIGYACFLGTCI